jgi:hypothetical protein
MRSKLQVEKINFGFKRSQVTIPNNLQRASMSAWSSPSVVRDYRFTAGHLKKRGYDNEQASRELAGLKNSLDPDLYQEMRALEQERDELVTHQTWQNPLGRMLTAAQSRASRTALILRRRVLEF